MKFVKIGAWPSHGWLWMFLFLNAFGVAAFAQGVVINEIMYHPLQPQFGAEPVAEEFIELFNTTSTNISLNGWRFSKGVDFTFTNVTLSAGGYLVISPNVNIFKTKHPGVNNVVGNWIGTLGNNGETITLKNEVGDVVDSVEYGTEGDWAQRQRGPDDRGHRGWKWYCPASGGGKSMERRNPFLPNSSGQNWAFSTAADGSPGKVNGAFSQNIGPLVLDAAHSPLIPKSTDTVAVTARLLDEQRTGVSAILFWRVDSTTPPGFTQAAMFDDGTHGDGAAGDGIFGAIIPAQANNTVVEFFVRAVDSSGLANYWPEPAIAAADGTGPSGTVANALYQVDNDAQNTFGVLSPSQPVYKLIMTESERAELAGIPCSNAQESDAEMNGTWITLEGAGQELRYLCGFRNRGHGSRCANPPNYRVNIPNDQRWHGVSALNLNAVNPTVQILGATVSRLAGVPGALSRPVQLRVNNVNRASSGGNMLGVYAANEEINTDWAALHYPDDEGGNIYRAIRDINPPDFVYRGPLVSAYTNTYFKTDNVSAQDWTDLIQLHRVMGTNDLFTTANIRKVADVEEWLTYYAVENLLGNAETSPNIGYNDDYSMYRGVTDPRFRLIYYDNDSILGVQSRNPGDGIFSAEANNGMGAMTTRFLESPDFKPLYYATLQRLLNTTFADTNFNSVVDQTFASFPQTSAKDSLVAGIKGWMDTRRVTVRAAINGQVPNLAPTPIAVIRGEPRVSTSSGAASLTVSGTGVVAYKYSLNGGAYGAEQPVSQPIALSNLPTGSTNQVAVIGKNSAGVFQDVTNATLSRVWVVRSSIPRVRINEVLAHNNSAASQNGIFPDLVELYNESDQPIDLSGLSLSANANNPDKFTFPAGTSISARGYLILQANDKQSSPGIHLGFSLDQDGDAVYLFDNPTRGGVLLDSLVFGPQVADKSIGRLANDDWVLCQPTFGAPNIAQSTGNPATLKLNEWLASGVLSSPDDFIELYNPEALPVALEGLYLTSEPIASPRMHLIAPLSFISGQGFLAFKADGRQDAGPNHLSFSVTTDAGELALFSRDLVRVDQVSHFWQSTGVSEGRCPDGSTKIVLLTTPTPGAPNLCPTPPPEPVTVSVLPFSATWKYEQTANLDGVNWTATNYNDASWAQGQGVFAVGNSVAEPTRTTLKAGKVGNGAYYFRTTFNAPTNTAGLDSYLVSFYIDDGAIFYLNGKEFFRYNMRTGVVTNGTFSSSNISGNPPLSGPAAVPLNTFLPGLNYLAVEVHQPNATSPDLTMGFKIDALVTSSTTSGSSAGLLINEVFAHNTSVPEPDGSTPTWVEIYNPSTNSVDLGGMSLTDDTQDTRRWVFPSPQILGPKNYATVLFNPGDPASNANTGFGLKKTGDSIYLFNKPSEGGGLLDFIHFGLQAANFSIGRLPTGGTNWVLTVPSKGAANVAAPIGNTARVKVNEWMADPQSGDDWFELFNPEPQPVAIGGYWLSDDLASALTRQKSPIPALSFLGIGTDAYQKFAADNNAAAGADHVNFNLKASGESVGLSTPAGALVDGIAFGAQQKGVSEGRLPDGTTNIVAFAQSASPGEANFLLLPNVVINEALTHTDPPLEDAIELLNTNTASVDISGWYLSDDKDNLKKFQIPNGIVMPAGAYRVFYETQFNDTAKAPMNFSLSSAHGDQIYLSAAANNVLTGYRTQVKFGAAQNGVSFGRYKTSTGEFEFVPMVDRTFGVDSPTTVEQFRTGTGKPNTGPRVGPVVFNEIMYHPPPIGTNDNTRDEFIELKNVTGIDIPLFDPAYPTNRWKLRGGVDFDFPANLTLGPGQTVLIVGFDPVNDPLLRAGFEAAYQLPANTPLLGPWSGKLDNGGESLELYRPDSPQLPGAPDAGFVPYILVEQVVFSDVAPWPASGDGDGASLQRVNAAAFGNDPANWTAGTPTPSGGAAQAADSDGDGLPDTWEIAYGLNPNNPADAQTDSDGDGLTNLQEYRAGTDPRNRDSVLKLQVAAVAGSSIVLRLDAMPNVGYVLQAAPDLTSGQWQDLQQIPAESTRKTIDLTQPVSGTKRFFRLRLL